MNREIHILLLHKDLIIRLVHPNGIADIYNILVDIKRSLTASSSKLGILD